MVSRISRVSSNFFDGRAVTFFDYLSKGMIGESEFKTNYSQSAALVEVLRSFCSVEHLFSCNGNQLKQNLVFMNKLAEILAFKFINS